MSWFLRHRGALATWDIVPLTERIARGNNEGLNAKNQYSRILPVTQSVAMYRQLKSSLNRLFLLFPSTLLGIKDGLPN